MNVENLFEVIRSIVEREEIVSFYIGKTDNIEKRKKDEKYEDYTLISIVEGDCKKIFKLEEVLIEHFIGYRNCDNVSLESCGNPDADSIYLAYQEDVSITLDDSVDDAWRKIYNSDIVLPIDADEIEL